MDILSNPRAQQLISDFSTQIVGLMRETVLREIRASLETNLAIVPRRSTLPVQRRRKRKADPGHRLYTRPKNLRIAELPPTREEVDQKILDLLVSVPEKLTLRQITARLGEKSVHVANSVRMLVTSGALVESTLGGETVYSTP